MELTADLFIRYFLGGYFTFIAVFYSVKLMLNRSGSALTHTGQLGQSQYLGQMTFRLFRLIIWAVCVARIFYPIVDDYLIMITPLLIPSLNLLGVAFILIGFGLIVICHQVLKQHWRLGIAPEGPNRLITSGVYARTRNPIFIGVLIGQLGFFLALPSAFSLVCLAIGIITVLNQIRLEEAHLSDIFKQQYRSYCESVPRYI
jgi:protein-S-isoprenylcysteine O-methyltransferase Ste14